MTADLAAMIIGAQKSGTSSLLAYMAHSPRFARQMDSELTAYTGDPDTVDLSRAVDEAFAHAAPDQLRVAKHATLMYHPDALQRLVEHRPDVHLVVLLRDPVARAHSHYWFRRARGLEPCETFLGAIAADDDREGDYRTPTGRAGYIDHGLYARHLAPLLQSNADHVHIWLLEDLKADARRVCRDLATILGAPDPFQNLPLAPSNAATRSRMPTVSRWLNAGGRGKVVLRRVLPRGASAALGQGLRRINATPFTPARLTPVEAATIRPMFHADIRRLSELLKRDDVLRWST